MSAAQKYSARIPLFVGLLCLVILIGGIGIWSVNTKIAGAVIASGLVKVEANRQIIQHPEGGVVGELLARDGDSVAAGQIVMKLDGTLLASELTIIEDQYFDTLARKARLLAERDGAEDFGYSDELLKRGNNNTDFASQLKGQTNLFNARRDTIDQQKDELVAQQDQIRSQIMGVEAQLDAARLQSKLIREELVDAKSLFEKGLIQASRYLALQRTDAEILGSIGQAQADIANLRGNIGRLNLRMIQLDTGRREDAITELRSIQAAELELAERRLAVKERLDRLDIRAPMQGVIYGSTIFALKAVVRPADPLMYVIPQGQPLLVEARVSAVEIDSVFVGQPVRLRFSAFNQRTTPEIEGTVLRLSADVVVDQATGIQFYQADIQPDAGEIEKLGDVEVVPGMPVEALIKTEARSPLSYLTKPLTDYFNRAFREVL